MVSANWKLGRSLALLNPQTKVQQGLGVAPSLAALLLASCFALPSAQADGWQGGRSWGSTGGNYHDVHYYRGGYRGGGYHPGYGYRRPYGCRPYCRFSLQSLRASSRLICSRLFSSGTG
jgi:hypothetical protein